MIHHLLHLASAAALLVIVGVPLLTTWLDGRDLPATRTESETP